MGDYGLKWKVIVLFLVYLLCVVALTLVDWGTFIRGGALGANLEEFFTRTFGLPSTHEVSFQPAYGLFAFFSGLGILGFLLFFWMARKQQQKKRQVIRELVVDPDRWQEINDAIRSLKRGRVSVGEDRKVTLTTTDLDYLEAKIEEIDRQFAEVKAKYAMLDEQWENIENRYQKQRQVFYKTQVDSDEPGRE